MLDILNIIPNKKRYTSSGWYSFNAVCCHHRGHKPDKRGRAGILFTENHNWSYNCFNCHFKCGFVLGKHFSKNTKQLLEWCGLDNLEIEKLSFESFTNRSILDLVEKTHKKFSIQFSEKSLPDDSILIDENNSKHKIHIDYLKKRGLNAKDHNFYCVDNESRERIIIPYYYNNVIVGHTSRYYDNRTPKYISEQQKGYIFNIDRQNKKWDFIVLVEGQFDALSIDGCAYMGSTITNEQADMLSQLHKRIVVVPDHDITGLSICDRALELGYSISLPEWESDVKDVNDAVVRYGKLPTLLSIIQSITNSKIKIEMFRKRFK